MMSKSGSRIKIESESEIKTKIVVEQAEETWRSHGHIVKYRNFSMLERTYIPYCKRFTNRTTASFKNHL